MTPLVLFLLACGTVYIGTVEAAFTALMRLPLRLEAERQGGLDRGGFLEEPERLFVPARLLQGVLIVLVASVVLNGLDVVGIGALGGVVLTLVAYVLVCAHLVPLILVRRDPAHVLVLLLPSFQIVAGVLRPLTRPLVRLLAGIGHRPEPAANGQGAAPDGAEEGTTPDERAALEEQEERELLQSVVEFADTLVREVMTPRPDIVAVPADATLDELRNVFIERHYSRLPVFEQSLDTVLGFVFVKDLVALSDTAGGERVVSRLLRPAYVVPETKRVAELLKELQRERVQSAIVHDEYGGTAGLVTIEDLLEEIVGEIRDEYDVETEPIVDEGAGSFVFDGRVSIDDAAKELDVVIEPEGFETVAGYILARLGRVPEVGEVFDIDELSVEVLEAERRRLHRVRVRRRSEVEADAPA